MSGRAVHRVVGALQLVLLLGVTLAPSGIAAAQQSAEGLRLIRLKAVTFDPALGIPTLDERIGELIRKALALRKPAEIVGARSYYLVQFTRPVTAGVQVRLESVGAHIESYVPDRTLLVGLPAGVSERSPSLSRKYIATTGRR